MFEDDSDRKMQKHLNTLLCQAVTLLMTLDKSDPGDVETASLHITTKSEGRGKHYYVFPHLKGEKEKLVDFAARCATEHVKQAKASIAYFSKKLEAQKNAPDPEAEGV